MNVTIHIVSRSYIYIRLTMLTASGKDIFSLSHRILQVASITYGTKSILT